jgi:hypothetical protein
MGFVIADESPARFRGASVEEPPRGVHDEALGASTADAARRVVENSALLGFANEPMQRAPGAKGVAIVVETPSVVGPRATWGRHGRCARALDACASRCALEAYPRRKYLVRRRKARRAKAPRWN